METARMGALNEDGMKKLWFSTKISL